jgi:hypothetical protein
MRSNEINDIDGFLGATDSAVPCSQILHLVSQLDKELKESKEKVPSYVKMLFHSKYRKNILVLSEQKVVIFISNNSQ